MLNIISHKGEYSRVVGSCCQNQLIKTERVSNSLCHVASCKVVNGYLGRTLGTKLISKGKDRFFSVAVHRGVRYNYSVLLRLIARPRVIKVKIIPEIFRKHGTVKRANLLYIKSRGFFKKRLHLRAVFADYSYIISSRLVSPRLIRIRRAEFSKPVSREKHLVGRIVSNYNLRPMHHRSCHERKPVLAKLKRIALCYDYFPVRKISAEEILHHGKSLCRRNYFCTRIRPCEIQNIRRVIGLHMLNYKIIRQSLPDSVLNIVYPFVSKSCIDRIHNSNLFINNYVRIISHSVRNAVLSLEKINPSIVDSDVFYVIRDFHFKYLF